MKKILFLIFVFSLAFSLFSCAGNLFDGTQQNQDTGELTTTAAPGAGLDLNSLAVALSSACGSGHEITWVYSPTNNQSYNPLIDGSVSAAGIFTAPSCGSSLLGSSVSIVGTCSNASGSVFAGTVSVKIKEEQVSGQTIGFASVSDCGAALCSASDPSKIAANICTSGSSFTVQFFSKITYTCGPVWSPSDPPANLPTCSVTISPGS